MTALPMLAPLLLAAALMVAPRPPGSRARGDRRAFGGAEALARLPRRGVAAGAVVVAAGLVAFCLTPAAAASGLLLCACLQVRRRARVRRRRVAAQRAALAVALESMVAELRIGVHPIAAMEAAVAEHDSIPATALAGVAACGRLGGDVPAAVARIAAGSPIADLWLRLASVWRLAAEHGVAISVLLYNAQRDVDERHRHARSVEAELAGARASIAILAGLPLLGVLLGHGLDAHPVAFLTGSGAGGWCLLAGTVFLTAGVLWAGAITDRISP